MEIIVILVVGYVLGQCIYVYHTNAKLRTQCENKTLYQCLHLLMLHVRKMHQTWYRDSKAEQVVEDLTQEAREFTQEVQRESNDLAEDISQVAREAATKVKDSIYHNPTHDKPKTTTNHKKKK